MTLRRRAALAVLASAAFAVFVLPASPASALDVSNACRNSVTANNSQIGVDTTADDSPDPVVPGGTVTLDNLTQTANVPGSIFVAGYNLGLLTVGQNNIPATVSTFIEGTNTVEGVQQTPFVATSISTTISDPDGTPSTGDETATDGSFTVVYPDMTFTASGPDGSTIEFREDTRTPLSVATGAEVGGIIIRAVIGGFLSVRFACSPGTVAPSNPPPGDPNPGIITFTEPAPAFDTTLIQTPVVDDPPTADAGTDQTVDEGDLVTLDGSLSSDPNGEALTYAWTAPAGITLTGADTANPTFTAPQVDANTPFAFVLQVCDEAPTVLCDTDTVVVNVLDVPVDDPPTANAGPDQTVDEGDLVTLAGSGTDPEGETLTFEWTAPAGVTLSDPTSASPTFTAPQVDADTPLTFTLEVCDEADPTSLCDTDTVVINVLDVPPEVDDPPTANAGPDQLGVPDNTLVTLAGSGTDPEGETLTFQWTAPAGVTLSDPTSPTPTFTAQGPASLTFSLVVCDEADPVSQCSAPDTVLVTVQAPPMIDAAGEVIVNGPVGPATRKTSKPFVFKVSNDGTTPITITAADITTSVTVNGTATGTASVAGLPVTLGPGSSKRLKATWSYAAGAFAAGDTIEFTACVNLAGDVDTTNDCGTATATAK